MLVVPVLDLLGGSVVRGIAGRRETYRPMESPLSRDARPETVAESIRETFGLTTFYVADLDAIAGRPQHRKACDELRRRGFTLWLDAGIADGPHAASVIADSKTRETPALREMLTASETPASGETHLVAGLETLRGPEALNEVLKVAGPERTIFSLDLKAGRPLIRPGENWSDDAFAGDHAFARDGVSRADESSFSESFAVARRAISQGVHRMIVLDLTRVGVGDGVGTETLCRGIADAFPHIELIAGGGVRSRDDLERLANAGCRAALVASALHFGPLTRNDVNELLARKSS